ncbi:DUF1653 domain-containing protein [Kineothrix sedimenti]|uniref:DUF1653 domain-containing protein n=1 Tax=Kineothrix sedimenti TaxID=3123317 RepID=A0ABZ3EUH1_9FIRM
MQHIPQPHEIYRHFKGNTYQIITIAEHSETGEMFVIYQAMYGNYKTYARPMDIFLEKLDKEKYPQATQEYRFELAAMTQAFGEPANAPVKDPANGQEKVPAMEAKKELVIESVTVPISEQEEQILDIDPQVLKFLEADSYEERLNILTGIHHRITDDMINVMAIATDIEVKSGDIEERFLELRNCLLKLEKFECNRLR